MRDCSCLLHDAATRRAYGNRVTVAGTQGLAATEGWSTVQAQRFTFWDLFYPWVLWYLVVYYLQGVPQRRASGQRAASAANYQSPICFILALTDAALLYVCVRPAASALVDIV